MSRDMTQMQKYVKNRKNITKLKKTGKGNIRMISKSDRLNFSSWQKMARKGQKQTCFTAAFIRQCSFIFFPKSFQNLSQNCKFLFWLLLSVSQISTITNACSYFLTFTNSIQIALEKPMLKVS